MEEQLEFNLNAQGPPQSQKGGSNRWLDERAAHLLSLSRKIGLPLDKAVEVTLKNGLVLRGVLHLAEEEGLWIEQKKRNEAISLPLCIGKVQFCSLEVVSCVRTD